MLGAIWIVDVHPISIIAIPLIDVRAITTGGILAMGCRQGAQTRTAQNRCLIPCGVFTNIGSIGALIPPSVYELDLDLANACCFFTTSALIVVLSELLMLIRMI